MRARLAHVRDLLRNHRITRSLVEQRQRELDMLATVRARLPVPARAHCTDICASENKLILFLDSAAWATRLRFLTTEIAASLKPWKIGEVRIQTRPRTKKGPEPLAGSRPERRLSQEAVGHLLEAASHMDDARISRALTRLALSQTAPRSQEPGPD